MKNRISWDGELFLNMALAGGRRWPCWARDADAISRQDIVSGIIQTRSYIFGAWVYAGILGAIFWAWVWVMVLKALMKVDPPKLVLPHLVPWMAFELLWAILFSPYSVGAHVIAPYYIVVLMSYGSVAQPGAVRSASSKVTGLARKRLQAA